MRILSQYWVAWDGLNCSHHRSGQGNLRTCIKATYLYDNRVMHAPGTAAVPAAAPNAIAERWRGERRIGLARAHARTNVINS